MVIDKKKLYSIIAIVVIIIAILIGFLLGKSSNTNTETNPSGEIKVPFSATHAEVPTNITVPDQNTASTSVSKDVAIPTVSIPAAPGVSAQLRTFNITAQKEKFTPSTVIAYTGDTIHINFTAVDREYDITFPDYNMKQTAQKGQTKILEFQAQATGKFTYYCELCGGLKSSALGYIIVAPLKTQ